MDAAKLSPAERDLKLDLLLPGKAQGETALVEALQVKWQQIETEVQALVGKYEELKSQRAFEKVRWGTSISVPKHYWARGAEITKTEHRAIKLSQLNELAALVHQVFTKEEYLDHFSEKVITWDTVNLYHINEHQVLPLTYRFQSSFVDLIADDEQKPVWFISHWWGTPFKETVALMNWHARCRKLGITTTYWICTFAINQHQLGELSGNLIDTPFVKAIYDPHCLGTCALFDANATTFSRIWCIMEGHVSTMEVRKSKLNFCYDLCGILPKGFKGACLRMDLGNGDAEDFCEGNTVFPGIISKNAMSSRIEQAKASVESDRRHILHYIAGTPLDRFDEEPPEQHQHYEELNHSMRCGFAGQALIKAIKESDVDAMKAILDEFPQAIHFKSKRAGSIWDIAHRGRHNPEVVAIVVAAWSSLPETDGPKV